MIDSKESWKIAQSIVGVSDKRSATDFYPTPEIATTSLLKYEIFTGSIWECACGDGRMSRVLESWGYDVISTDKYFRDYGYVLDFLSDNELLAPNIVTNPPYRFGLDFLEKALSFDFSKIAFLLKIQFLEGVKRHKILKSSPLRNVLVFSKRLTILRPGTKKKGGGMITYAWFIWENGYCGKPEIDWI